MNYLKLTEALKEEIEPELKSKFPNREIMFELNHWHNNRCIKLSTGFQDFSIHYEYLQGFVELHLEDKYSNSENNEIWRRLVSVSRDFKQLSWHRWYYRTQGRCRLNVKIENARDIIDAFTTIDEIFNDVFEEKPNLSLKDNETNASRENNETLPDADKMAVRGLTYYVQTLSELPFEHLVIPEYQRPYKWSTKNVGQLITDILHFKHCKEYRLGTLVMHESNIVDGQQRIVTIALLLHQLFKNCGEEAIEKYRSVYDRINIFWKRTRFKNRHSIGHVRENLECIVERSDELTEDFLDFLLCRCRFVVVRLPLISEAFQFFDSQNSRGKDLVPHDLLKAFHLREIPEFSNVDIANLSEWHNLGEWKLVKLFLSLYRVKRWARNNSGRSFTKDDISAFKGISPDEEPYPFHLMPQLIERLFAAAESDTSVKKIIGEGITFPFQLDRVVINGRRFFDMVRHYSMLHEKIVDAETFKSGASSSKAVTAHDIICLLNSYSKRNRTGDVHVRQLFDCLLIYYVDRFGFVEIDKIVRKIFKFVYNIRLSHYSVQLTTVDNSAINGKLFKAIRDAQTPYEILSLSNPQKPTSFPRSADEELIKIYQKL